MQQVMFNEAIAHSCYADAHGMVDEGIYDVYSEQGGQYELRWKPLKYALFKCEWFVPVHYSTEIPLEGKQLLITDYRGNEIIITPRAVVETDIYSNVYKVYEEEREDFYVVCVNTETER